MNRRGWVSALLTFVGSVALSHPFVTSTADRWLLGGGWFALLLALSAVRRSVAWFGAGVAGLAGLGLWLTSPHTWLLMALVLVVATLATGMLDGLRAPTSLTTSIAVALGFVLPLGLTLGIFALGGLGADLLRQNLALTRVTDATFVERAVTHAVVAGIAVLAIRSQAFGLRQERAPGSPGPRATRWLGRASAIGIVALFSCRVGWLISRLSLPSEAQWSEAPHLHNLLKLHAGAPLYGPIADCNSYLYSPLLELLHRSLLIPWGLDLSLVANRCLNLLWHGATLGILAWALWPSLRLMSLLPRTAAILGLWLVVTSSFLAPHLHPDHLAMIGFAAAIALVVARTRLWRPLFWAGLLLVPLYATTAKLTGAGVGLGLVLAHCFPLGKRELAALVIAGALALLTIPLFNATLGDFSFWAIELQASHPIRWGHWSAALMEPAGRLAICVALMAIVVQRLGREHAAAFHAALHDSARLGLLTLGFMLPSLLAYLKVGGRSNSLLPLAIGSAAIALRLAEPLLLQRPRALLAPGALAMVALLAWPEPEPQLATSADARHARTVELLRRELERGPTLLYGSTAAWLAAGRRDAQLDRGQTTAELVLGRHPGADGCYARLEDGSYRSIVMSSHLLTAPYVTDKGRLKRVLESNFELVTPRAPPPAAEVTPLVFRWTGPGER